MTRPIYTTAAHALLMDIAESRTIVYPPESVSSQIARAFLAEQAKQEAPPAESYFEGERLEQTAVTVSEDNMIQRVIRDMKASGSWDSATMNRVEENIGALAADLAAENARLHARLAKYENPSDEALIEAWEAFMIPKPEGADDKADDMRAALKELGK